MSSWIKLSLITYWDDCKIRVTFVGRSARFFYDWENRWNRTTAGKCQRGRGGRERKLSFSSLVCWATYLRSDIFYGPLRKSLYPIKKKNLVQLKFAKKKKKNVHHLTKKCYLTSEKARVLLSRVMLEKGTRRRTICFNGHFRQTVTLLTHTYMYIYIEYRYIYNLHTLDNCSVVIGFHNFIISWLSSIFSYTKDIRKTFSRFYHCGPIKCI